jgi:hypothetical protein
VTKPTESDIAFWNHFNPNEQKQQRLWAHIEPASSLPEKDSDTMSKKAKDPNNTLVIATRADAALRNLEKRQRKAFENFQASWKAKRAAVLAELTPKAVEMLVAGGQLNSHDLKVRDQAIADRVLQEESGGEPPFRGDLIDEDH